jgi:phosphatidate cytidylyltransferase
VLKQRVITALILLPLLLAAIWFLPTPWLALLLSAVILLAAREWSVLTTVARPAWYLAAAAALLLLVSAGHATPWLWIPVVGTCLWWLGVSRWIAVFPAGFTPTHPPQSIFAAAGLLVIPGTIAAVALLHGAPQGVWKLLFALFLVFAADVGAYFAGKAFGRHKLAPNVSPGKTWEGALGGLALAAVVALVAGRWLFGLGGAAWAGFLLVCVGVVAISVIGDLGESLIKRRVGAKDSGTLLPGHGGMLDRIDSLLAALPAMAVGLKVLGL